MQSSWLLLFPLAVGIATVMQGTFNKQIARDWAISEVLFFNGIVFFICTALYFYIARFHGGILPEFLHETHRGQELRWWYILPGVFGFVIVFGLPISIESMGALKVFIAVVCAQMITSLLWDFFIENTGISSQKIIAALLVIAATVVINI